MNDSQLSDLLATMGVLVLSRDDGGALRMEGTPPLWYVRLFPEAAQSRDVDVLERFPFLESFLPTAENFWGSNAHGRIRSGEWTETLGGKDVPLQASAVVLDRTPLLLVEHVRSDYERIQGILQKARERELEADTAEQLQRTLHLERLRRRALLQAVPGTLFRLRADGAVLEGPSADGKGGAGASETPPHARTVLDGAVADVVLAAGARAMASASPETFELPDGRKGCAAPVGTAEFWAVLVPDRSD